MANALNKVNSGGIEDGSIVNADIKSDAAIAGSKLVAATTSVPGSMSAADKTKLDGVATSATANPSAPALTGSTNNTVCTVTGANAIQGEANLTFDGSTLNVTGNTTISTTNDSGATILKLENNSTANSTQPSVDIKADLANGKAGGSIQFVRSSTYQSSAGADSEVRINPAKNDANTESLRITNDYVRLNSGMSGLQFNADTAAGNALNDYEEGTWTPSFFGNSTAGTASVGNATGNYTKVGNLVHVQYYSGTFSMTGSAGQAKIGGLPFTALGTSGGYAVISFSHTTCFTASASTGHVDAGATTISMHPHGSSTSADSYKNESGKYLLFDVTYLAAS